MQLYTRFMLRVRILGVVITIIAMFFILRHIQPKALGEILRNLHASWFLGAILLYGSLFLPAAWRWHLALQANGSAVGLGTSLRLSLIGHFFYTVFFGAAGGDVTKSALYARWHHLPMTNILAASSLDRLLGFMGLLLFATLTFALAAREGGLTVLSRLSLRWPSSGLVGFLIVLLVLAAYLKRAPEESLPKRFLRTFIESGGRLIRSPGNFGIGIFCGLAVQMMLSGVLALSLQAVHHEPIAWLQMAWTFPVISVVSALPITIAGLGVRDSAAMVLFGLYHVSASDAVAAALLTASISLLWMVVGGALLWWEALKKEPNCKLMSFSEFLTRLKAHTA